ncbi:winged helix-turn-helix transcriptional regulator [Plantactinospora sp. S1510]|uniref:Winged helix-turn-helix transcriptional regulator n=1 Tax=Plantactinospora alkalitolerans TaxID=2789879 RepID=A0ABS0GZJ5_9ACTN|nr:winged helix-turn-helix transcriptional regulator [Plantactinospora alkalitolerans]MBF9131636.1 winged helix-turn-helix transcriptional regulator [Plantactinospora alkalitolerans]
MGDDRSNRPGAGLGPDRIVRTAVRLADAEGLETLSMRRVATALDAGVMSLYRHVPGRRQLVNLMVETVFGELDYPDPGPAGWRARIEFSARREWAMYQRHPWVLSIVAGTTRPPLGPNVLANVEWVLRAVDGFGLDRATMTQIYFTVSDYVQGAALYIRNETEDERRTGVTAEQWWAAEAATLLRLLCSGRFPLLSGLFDRAASAPTLVVKDFEFGLRRVLDGLEVFLAEQRHRHGSAATSTGTGSGTAEATKFEKVTTIADRSPSPAAAAALELLGRRWTLELLFVLSHGEARFTDLVEAVPGVSRRVLTERLRQLADEGLLRRQVVTGPPIRISYALTDRGAGLRGALAEIDAWAGTRSAPDGAGDRTRTAGADPN